MPSAGQIVYYSAVVAWSAAIYQFLIKDLLSVSLGLGRVIQSIDEFPGYSCSRIQHPQLEACEDLWLDERDRTLYAACGGTQSRMAWNPSISLLNASGRRISGSEFLAIDVDSFGTNGFFSLRTITPTGSFGATGEPTLDALGFSAETIDDQTIHFYFANVPPYHGSLFPASQTGANASVEVFEFKRGNTEMSHLRTVQSPAIWSPNRPVALSDGAFLVTNDHGAKVGWRKQLEPLIGGGNVAYCPASGSCRAATPPPGLDIRKSLKFPNGLTRGHDGLIYVPSSVDGTVAVFALQPDGSLTRVHTVRVGMPLDNISPDARGDLWVPGFPDSRQTMKGLENPYEEVSPATVWRIKRERGAEGEVRNAEYVLEYEVEKVLEDREAKVLDGVTTVVHDVKSGRLFMGGAAVPFMVVCEPRV
ncbi:hypothetical protein E8E13_001436 [Curvularia kusanoi]|uniref:Calcium-dependent phosphotriesterase n=1 Tax=Curvularia kusanoi TaxID=90978 RepID=A0A9P4W6C6_CURKU|nr:hypothetical protein E8E13_001436 [Curvularia kusanoi]